MHFRTRTVTIGAGERAEPCVIIDGPIFDEAHESKEIYKKVALDAIIETLQVVGDSISHNYAKAFLNNCILVNDKSFPTREDKDQARAAGYKYIVENLKPADPPKDIVKDYMDNFPLRPFTGEAVKQLPKYKQETDTFDWDDLYINSALTKKELHVE